MKATFYEHFCAFLKLTGLISAITAFLYFVPYELMVPAFSFIMFLNLLKNTHQKHNLPERSCAITAFVASFLVLTTLLYDKIFNYSIMFKNFENMDNPSKSIDFIFGLCATSFGIIIMWLIASILFLVTKFLIAFYKECLESCLPKQKQEQ